MTTNSMDITITTLTISRLMLPVCLSIYIDIDPMVPICSEWWCTEAIEATQTHCNNSVVSTYPVWAYYVHGWQCRCQEDLVRLPSGRLEKTSPHHVAQHCTTGSETTPPYAPQSSRFGTELPSVEDDVDVWRYAILELHARNDDDEDWMHLLRYFSRAELRWLFARFRFNFSFLQFIF